MLDENSFEFERVRRDIYESYLNTIQKLLIDVEVVSGRFPTQVLNEIRATFTHLARAERSYPSDMHDVRDNCEKALRHIKRGRLDCYKALCMAYDDYAISFERANREVNLGIADNGRFLAEFTKNREAARSRYVAARRQEAEALVGEADIFNSYEMAYCAYFDFVKFLNCEDTQEQLVFARQMTDRNKELIEENTKLTKRIADEVEGSTRKTRLSIVLGIVSVVFAVVSIVEGVLLAILT